MVKAHGFNALQPRGHENAPERLAAIEGGTPDFRYPRGQGYRNNFRPLKGRFPDDGNPLRYDRVLFTSLVPVQGLADQHAAIRLISEPGRIEQGIHTDGNLCVLGQDYLRQGCTVVERPLPDCLYRSRNGHRLQHGAVCKGVSGNAVHRFRNFICGYIPPVCQQDSIPHDDYILTSLLQPGGAAECSSFNFRYRIRNLHLPEHGAGIKGRGADGFQPPGKGDLRQVSAILKAVLPDDGQPFR